MAGIVWWEIETRDPRAFQRFHEDMWGWQFQPAFADTQLGADYWIIQDGDDGIGGLQHASSDAPPQVGTRIYLEVDDLEAALARVVENGGRIERARTELGGDDRWFATILDPTGISFGLWTSRQAAGLSPMSGVQPAASGA